MSLEAKSQELKNLIGTYNTEWLLGDLSAVMHAGKERARDQLESLSSPMRQLYYLAGLNVSTDPANGIDIIYNPEKWSKITKLLNDIESEYLKLFFPKENEEITNEWKRVRKVAMPSFLSYFNQGPLNYEEQVINWVEDLFTPLDKTIEEKTGLKTADFIQFYNNLDNVRQTNFRAHSTNKELLRPNWKNYTKIKMGVREDAPDFIKEYGKEVEHISTYMSDQGIIDRFYPNEIISADIDLDKVNTILRFLCLSREENDFLYYTSTRPGNPLIEKPIVDIGSNLYQVFEIKQVIHAINYFLEQLCNSTTPETTKYIEKKGNLLEKRIVALFTQFLGDHITVFTGYYVDGCEQDILILWERYAFIIEAKGYKLHEPFRDPEKAFVRISNDFASSIGYGYTQTRRVEKKFIDEVPLRITDKNGNIIEEIDTTLFEQDFSIIVNLESFGQIQCDLSTLIKLEDEEDVYPWAVKLDDLEIFLLAMIAKKVNQKKLVDFLMMREQLHGKLICSDELEICGGYMTGKLTRKSVRWDKIITTTPDLGNIFDKLYHKGLGFKNEKYLQEKQSGKYIFW